MNQSSFLEPYHSHNMINVAPVLKRCEVFVGLDDSDVQKIASLSSWQRNTYKPGDYVFRQDATANCFYVLEEGEISLLVTIQTDDPPDSIKDVPVDTVTTGDIFGWSSLVAPHSLTMSALCIKPSTVLIVSGTELVGLLDCNPAIGYEVMKGLVRVIGARFRDLRRRFANEDKTRETHR
ncbi:MAG: cyclic nucleotide-binding domain-containing protein [Chloroflexi bacterium]|nr:cyclic nucleotide-binding domain-containing protein [Chloroflexota bacterium]MBM3153848.1 cyclic nucleotide-binding domain-containing protein [Chloroflexota bacterium]MBM3165837.1 cyclic nucleotide-binding domain-containing protein [Chloroflexota bacterium]MBM4449301.1 cyclic nucleotide-binding domain-containing protein [Chloroflexota bacterium]